MLNEEGITSRPFYNNKSVNFVGGYENHIFQITAMLVALTHVNQQFYATTITEVACLKPATDIVKVFLVLQTYRNYNTPA